MVGNDNYENGDHVMRAGPAKLVPALFVFWQDELPYGIVWAMILICTDNQTVEKYIQNANTCFFTHY